jgi:hypothetical protein
MTPILQPDLSENDIRQRSYLLWEHEGRPDGHSADYWHRARAELEAEMEKMCRAAALAGETARFVLPKPPISTPPRRAESRKIDPKDEPAGAAR